MDQNFELRKLENNEQAEGIRDLFLEVYGDGYPIELYYRPEELLKTQADDRILVVVAADQQSNVRGHIALYPSAPSTDVREVGAILVSKSARGVGLAGRLISHIVQQAIDEDICEFVFAESVCNHTVTQRHFLSQDFVETAIEIDLMPAGAYSKEDSAQGRVSSVLSFRNLRQNESKVCLPEIYRQELLDLYEFLPVKRTVERPVTAPMPPATACQANRIEMAGLLRLVVSEVGQDFESHLAEESDVFQLMLGLDLVNIDSAVSIARHNGFFFGGLLPCWTGVDTLLMQRLKSPPDWESNMIYSEGAQKLFGQLRSDFARSP